MDDPTPASPYREFPIQDAVVTEVHPDARRFFLVLSGLRQTTGKPWTLVLERQHDYWISRRDLHERFEPGAAVAGYLFNREGYQDPLEMLRRMNEIVRVEYYRMLQEKIKGERVRSELLEEVARLKGECEALKSQLRRKIGRGETTGRRSPAVSRKRASPSRAKRRQP